MSERSHGAFDPTVQPLWQLHESAGRTKTLPDEKSIADAKSKVDWRKLNFAADAVRVAPGMAVTLNGIAQGFGTDRALAVLKEHGIHHALLNTGEIGTLGARQDREPWKIGIQHPRDEDAYAALAQFNDGRCMATSGDYATAFSADRGSNHIFDPGTGRSPQAFSSVSIVAPSAMIADALSTAIFVAGLERGLKLVEQTRGADALFIRKDGTCVSTNGFPFARE